VKVVTGELKKWCRVELTFDGPETGETAEPNPFLDYRLMVTFIHANTEYVVPGFYAADGRADDSSASAGNRWQVYFTPDQTGEWTYQVSFRTGKDIAASNDPDKGKPVSFDGISGTFHVDQPGTTSDDARTKGRLAYVGGHYLRFAETGEYFLKAGADSPENFLAYREFDGTFDMEALERPGEATGDKFIHSYTPHKQDWRMGDPSWQDGKGKSIIGALNYLASKGMNSVYFLTMNVTGDGKDVWPWTSPEERFRFDCSKLDQWELVFSHMDRLGLMLHVITQETENDQLLDGGELGIERKLYYRELVARFAHHNALVWNLGEENTNTDSQRKQFASYIRRLDPYDHPIVVHTYPNEDIYESVYSSMLGFPDFEGPSLQTNDTHRQTIQWIDRSVSSGRKWIVCLDEIGPADTGVKPDKDDYWHDDVRKHHLWANLMAGGAGVEWYFGYNFDHNDLNCEDWRSRDHMWDLTRYAIDFFLDHLPFQEMKHHDELTANPNDYCFAAPGKVYAVYLPDGGSTSLDLGDSASTFKVKWYNPREGGPLADGTVKTVHGPGIISIGDPPTDPDKDWTVVIK